MTLFTSPDALVHCGQSLDEDRVKITDPLIVVEPLASQALPEPRIHVTPPRAPLFSFTPCYSYTAGGFGPMKYGRIISLSSCSRMWQCQT